MQKQLIYYRTRILFIGLTREEKAKVEVIFNRYSVTYLESLSAVKTFSDFDLFCISQSDFEQNFHLLPESKTHYVIIGDKVLAGAEGCIKRSDLVRVWLETIMGLVPPVKKPKLDAIDVGAIVRSKLTPLFGKGIVTAKVSDHEVLVKFSSTQLLSKNIAMRCHISQLQYLGKNDEAAA